MPHAMAKHAIAPVTTSQTYSSSIFEAGVWGPEKRAGRAAVSAARRGRGRAGAVAVCGWVRRRECAVRAGGCAVARGAATLLAAGVRGRARRRVRRGRDGRVAGSVGGWGARRGVWRAPAARPALTETQAYANRC